MGLDRSKPKPEAQAQAVWALGFVDGLMVSKIIDLYVIYLLGPGLGFGL